MGTLGFIEARRDGHDVLPGRCFSSASMVLIVLQAILKHSAFVRAFSLRWPETPRPLDSRSLMMKQFDVTAVGPLGWFHLPRSGCFCGGWNYRSVSCQQYVERPSCPNETPPIGKSKKQILKCFPAISERLLDSKPTQGVAARV